MILGTIDNIEINEFSPLLSDVLEYLRATDFSKLTDGDYKICDNKAIAKLQRYKTRPVTECKPETHNKFVDVQFIFEGEESLGWCPLSPDLKIETEYDETRDVTFYKKLVPESCVALLPRSFAVLYPVDVHRPCCLIDEPAEVTKVVVKIPVELLREIGDDLK